MMMKFFNLLFFKPSIETIENALAFMRIAIGILTIGHGIPKMFGGISHWNQLGATFMGPLGIHFLPVMWGFLGAVTEFIGGAMLVAGFATRIASLALILMMIVATAWHIQKGDSFNVWSFPFSLIFVYLTYFILGGGKFALDNFFIK